MKKLSLSRQFEDRTGAFFRFKPGVRRFPFNPNRINAGSLSSGLYMTTWCWWLQHKRTSRVGFFCHLFHEWPSGLTTYFFITCQDNGDSSLRFDLQTLESAQDF